ncbi:MAG: hypothetical protein IPK35_00545 [Saprospiraceae bacterium]|nr:hypothetical protein [Saprospiraceae bacterium]
MNLNIYNEFRSDDLPGLLCGETGQKHNLTRWIHTLRGKSVILDDKSWHRYSIAAHGMVHD